MVFSLKLDNGHKLLCPWIDNACDERLAEFPPTPPPVLVDKFGERSSALLQLLALPVVSSAAIASIRSPQLEEFLKQSSTLECGNGSANVYQIESLGNECESDSASLYYQVRYLLLHFFFPVLYNFGLCITFISAYLSVFTNVVWNNVIATSDNLLCFKFKLTVLILFLELLMMRNNNF